MLTPNQSATGLQMARAAFLFTIKFRYLGNSARRQIRYAFFFQCVESESIKVNISKSKHFKRQTKTASHSVAKFWVHDLSRDIVTVLTSIKKIAPAISTTRDEFFNSIDGDGR